MVVPPFELQDIPDSEDIAIQSRFWQRLPRTLGQDCVARSSWSVAVQVSTCLSIVFHQVEGDFGINRSLINSPSSWWGAWPDYLIWRCYRIGGSPSNWNRRLGSAQMTRLARLFRKMPWDIIFRNLEPSLSRAMSHIHIAGYISEPPNKPRISWWEKNISATTWKGL